MGCSRNLQKAAKICAITWTAIYLLLIPLAFYFAALSFMIFGHPHMSAHKGFSIICIISLIPISLPFSIDLMWSNYICKEYEKTLIFWSLPWFTWATVSYIIGVVERL